MIKKNKWYESILVGPVCLLCIEFLKCHGDVRSKMGIIKRCRVNDTRWRCSSDPRFPVIWFITMMAVCVIISYWRGDHLMAIFGYFFLKFGPFDRFNHLHQLLFPLIPTDSFPKPLVIVARANTRKESAKVRNIRLRKKVWFFLQIDITIS